MRRGKKRLINVEFSGQRCWRLRGVGARGQGTICWLLLQDTELSEVKAAGMADIQTEKLIHHFSLKNQIRREKTHPKMTNLFFFTELRYSPLYLKFTAASHSYLLKLIKSQRTPTKKKQTKPPISSSCLNV